jgi:hypothetical protein
MTLLFSLVYKSVIITKALKLRNDSSIQASGTNMKPVTIIEDLEYMGSGSFRLPSAGPLSMDFGIFGIEDNSHLLVPHLSPFQYQQFKEYIVDGRRTRHNPDDRGFHFETIGVEDASIPLIHGLAEKIQTICQLLPNEDSTQLNNKVRKMSGNSDLQVAQAELIATIGKYVLHWQ